MKFKICFLGLLCLFFRANCQEKDIHQGLKIGDKVPDIVLNHLINYPAKTAQLSNFKGKLLVLDFWSTWCISCIENMPELNKLKEHFGDSVQFISVNSQSIPLIEKFLAKHDFVNKLTLPMELGNAILDSLFPHRYVPHIVWISKNGIYLGATSQSDLNVNLISQILTSGKAEFSDAKSDDMFFDPDKPLFVNGNGGKPDLLFKETLAPFQPGLPSMIGIKQESDSSRIVGLNVSLYDLYCEALSIPSYRLYPNRIIYLNTTLAPIFSYSNLKKAGIKLYCYELAFRNWDEQTARHLLLHHLEDWFSIRVAIEKRTVSCYRLESKSDKNNLTAGAVEIPVGQKPLFTLINSINNFPDAIPVIDDKHLSRNIFVTPPQRLDIVSVNKSLIPYGLEFRKEEADLDMMIVSSINSSNPIIH